MFVVQLSLTIAVQKYRFFLKSPNKFIEKTTIF